MSDSGCTGADPYHRQNNQAPPAYTSVDSNEAQPSGLNDTKLTPEALAELTSAFSSLNLPAVAAEISPDSCLAHLKLLYAFQNLKEDVGYTDGLWQIFDSRAETDTHDYGVQLKAEDRVGRNLARLREKRWALYVARAVDRYESWWNTFVKDPLTEADMESNDQSKYSTFPDERPPFTFDSSMLPPLGRHPLNIINSQTNRGRCVACMACAHAQPESLP